MHTIHYLPRACPAMQMKKYITWILIWLSGLALAQAQSPPAPEFSIKSVFIYNFTQFVEWPAQAFTGPDSPFIIGIVGANPFDTYLLETVAGEKVGSHPIQVHHFQEGTELKECHLLYINLPDSKKIKTVLTALSHRHTLTVGDTPFFTREGGMIRFFMRNNKIRLEINPATVRAAQLTISSKLLNVAEITAQ